MKQRLFSSMSSSCSVRQRSRLLDAARGLLRVPVDGDGKKEMIAAAFRTGVWLLRPGKDPKGEWSVESVDRDSSGFEHAALLTDLDGDKIDELYVGADEQGELRRYVWVNGKAKREVIAKRELPRAMMTWNIMPAPAAMLK